MDAGSNYEVQLQEYYLTIMPKNINSTDVGLVTIGNQRYTGKQVKPTVTLRYGTETLVENKDFIVTYKDNIEPGTATVLITGIGNYTGERKTSFRIINITSGVVFSGFAGGSSGDYSYDFDGEGEFEDMEDLDGEGDAGDDDLDEAGRLMLEEDDFGPILFDAFDDPQEFTHFVEEKEDGTRELTIIANPMIDPESGEEMPLGEDEARRQYDQLHLRISPDLAASLREQNYTAILYWLEDAVLRIPLENLVENIPLEPEEEEPEEGNPAVVLEKGSDDEETVEIEGSLDPEVLEAEDEAIDGFETEDDDDRPVMRVECYDFCIEQAPRMLLSDREQQALEDREPLAPIYWLRIRAVPFEDESDDFIEPEVDVEDEESDKMEFGNGTVSLVDLPAYPAGVTLSVLLSGDPETEPENADALYVSRIDDPEDADIIDVAPAAFETIDDQLYAEIIPAGDGLYATTVLAPDEEAAPDAE